jgi:hypothetical protein
MRAALLLISVIFLFSNVSGQTSRGTVTGLVIEQKGGVIPDAQIILLNLKTSLERTTRTNDEGIFRFDAVDPGLYQLKISALNFSEVVKTGIEVLANQVVQMDTELLPAGHQITVDVTGDTTALLQTEAPVRGGNITSDQISTLPNADRNPVSFALTLPGVTTNRFSSGVGTFVINGARQRSNNFLIDGTENNDISIMGQGFQIKNPDSVQEVSVQTSNYDSEFGRAGGGVINVITKGGTNEFHGSLGFRLDSTADDAITSKQSLSPEIIERGRPPFGIEQWFSGTVGGPLFLPRFGEGSGSPWYNGRERTFFFFSYMNQRRRSNSVETVNTLSLAGRQRLRSLFAPGTNRNVDTYLAVTEGVNAVSGLSGIDLGLGRGEIEVGEASVGFTQKYTEHQLQGRIDHKIDDNDQLSLRYLFADQLDPFGGSPLRFPGFTTSNANRFQNFLLSETHVFSPSVTNELRLSYNRIAISLPFDPSSPLAPTLPETRISGLTTIGIPTTNPQGRIANNYVFQDTITMLKGNHTFRVGTDLLKQRSRQFAPIAERGFLLYSASTAFSAFANFVDDFGGSGQSTGSAIKDFGSAAYYPELFRQAYFIQDRWRVTPRLTLSLGLRYENFGKPFNSIRTPAYTGLFNVDPVTGTGPYMEPNKVNPDNNNFAPSVGVAYTPNFSSGLKGLIFGDERSVIRAGYQIGYESFFNNILSNAQTSSPNIVSTGVVSSVTAANPRGLANLSTRLPVRPRPVTPLDSQTLIDPNLKNPYYQRWSLGWQRSLPANFLLDLAYVGSKGTNLYINEDRNPFIGSRRLDPLQGSRVVRANSGDSNYHSGQLRLVKRLSSGLSLTSSYTWSKLIDNNSDIFAGSSDLSSSSLPIIPAVLGGERNERALGLFDRPHRASFTYTYELPFMRDQRGFLGKVFGGFQISGVTTFESGVPFTVTNGVDSNGLGGNNDRPDYNPFGQKGVRAQLRGSRPSPTGYVNPENNFAPIDPIQAEFIQLPANSGRTGTLGRHTERTRGINNWDFNIGKRIALSEGTSLELRTEFYNLFNHHQFGQGSVSSFSPGSQGIPANVQSSLQGQFLSPQFADGGGRVIMYNLRFLF